MCDGRPDVGNLSALTTPRGEGNDEQEGDERLERDAHDNGIPVSRLTDRTSYGTLAARADDPFGILLGSSLQ